MAKNSSKDIQKQFAKNEDYKYPSRFGSHKSMIIEQSAPDGYVYCKDEFGIYMTELNRLDNGLADRNRYEGR